MFTFTLSIGSSRSLAKASRAPNGYCNGAHHLAFAIANDCSRNQRLHGCLSKVRLIIFGRYSFGCAGERLVEISLIPLDVTRHVRDFSHLPSKRGGVVAAILTVFPVELEDC